MENKKTLYLIDGSSYIYRAYHAIRGLSNSEGFPTNAVYGFTRMLLKMIDEQNPEYVVLIFDAKGPTFRHEIYKDYKANRPPMPEDLSVQIPYIKEIVSGFNFPVLEMPGYEADDLIGTLARIAEKNGFTVVMVSGDKDFMQLITDNITVWDPMKEKRIDPNDVRESFGVEPGQVVDIMGLSGDTSDNIPGVPGIGPKTAKALIKSFGCIESLYEQIHKISKKKQSENLVKYKHRAFLSKRLVTIKTDVPLSFSMEDFKLKNRDNNKLSRLFKILEFRQLQHFIPASLNFSKKNYQTIQDMNILSDLVGKLESAGLFAIDTETTSKNPIAAKLVGLSFSMQADEAFYIPCTHDYTGVPRQLPLPDVLNRLKPLLENPGIKKVGQNIKYDWIVLDLHGIKLAGVIFDTMLASYLLNPSKRAHSLDRIALDFLDYKTTTYQEITGKGNKALSFASVPLEKAAPYACEDADITLKAYHILTAKLDEFDLAELFENVEMPLISVLMDMELKGVSIDINKLKDLSKMFEHQLNILEDSIYSLAGEKFNIKSSQQLGYILFEKIRLPIQKKTKKLKNYSTDVDVLTVLSNHHELPALILKYRTLAKLKSTYADALLELVNKKTGRIHTSYNQTVTATGRLSSSNPNLQNIPIRTQEGRDIRSAFIPRKGWLLVSADYSQMELRILAHYSNDKILIKAFMDGEDIHTRTAAEVFQAPPSFLTPDLRRQAKIINFGIIYGMGAFGLSKELGISRKMAQTYIDNYFERYCGVKQFIDQAVENAKKTKKTSTLLGRIRLLPEINSKNRNVQGFAERTAINTPIQGTSADLIKLAMIKISSAFKEKGLEAAMLLSVHDELVFELPPEELETASELIKRIMEGIWPLKVPLKVNIAYGKNWTEAHP